MDNKKNVYEYNEHGRVNYNKSIVKGIVLLAVSSVVGVALTTNRQGEKVGARSLEITHNKDGICIDIGVNVYSDFNIPDVAFNIQQSIKHNVESMSKYKIANIDVHILNVEFREEEESI